MVDRGLVSFSVLISSIPYYVIALLVWIYVSLQWKLIENTSYTPFTEDPVAWFTGLLLPWLAIGLAFSTSYARYSRGQMIETMGEDYVRTAVAKGAPSGGWSPATRCGRRSSRSSRSSASTSPSC